MAKWGPADWGCQAINMYEFELMTQFCLPLLYLLYLWCAIQQYKPAMIGVYHADIEWSNINGLAHYMSGKFNHNSIYSIFQQQTTFHTIPPINQVQIRLAPVSHYVAAHPACPSLLSTSPSYCKAHQSISSSYITIQCSALLGLSPPTLIWSFYPLMPVY